MIKSNSRSSLTPNAASALPPPYAVPFRFLPGFIRDAAHSQLGRGGFDPPPTRQASSLPLQDLDVGGRFSTRFFRVTRGSLAERDHKWTPDQGENIAFVLRFCNQ